MGVDRFEDLHAWQKARALTRVVYAATRDADVSRDYAYCNQIRRAAISAMSNIAEGFERARPREFHQFLSIAKASVAEVKSLANAGHDVGYIDDERLERLMTIVNEASNLVGALRSSVDRRIQAGNKRPGRAESSSGVSEHPAPSTQHASPVSVAATEQLSDIAR